MRLQSQHWDAEIGRSAGLTNHPLLPDGEVLVQSDPSSKE